MLNVPFKKPIASVIKPSLTVIRLQPFTEFSSPVPQRSRQIMIAFSPIIVISSGAKSVFASISPFPKLRDAPVQLSLRRWGCRHGSFHNTVFCYEIVKKRNIGSGKASLNLLMTFSVTWSIEFAFTLSNF